MSVPGGGTGNTGRDPGLQPERTALSWRRTLLALLVAELFIWRAWITALNGSGPGPGATVGLGVAALVSAAAGIVFSGCAVLRGRALGSRPPADAVTGAATMRTAAGALVALAASVFASVLLSAGR